MAGKQLKTLDTSALLALRKKIDALLAERRTELEAQLAAFNDGGELGNARAPRRSANGARKGRRAKAAPKYQSKKDKSLKWSGRGLMPVWMRDEMKGTKLKRDDFAIV